MTIEREDLRALVGDLGISDIDAHQRLKFTVAGGATYETISFSESQLQILRRLAALALQLATVEERTDYDRERDAWIARATRKEPES